MFALLSLILISAAFMLEAIIDASSFYKDSKIWKIRPFCYFKLNIPGDGMFKLDIFHLLKFLYLPLLFSSGYMASYETNIVNLILLLIFIPICRIAFFDRFLHFIKYWR